MYVTFLTTRALESHNILAHLEDARLTPATQVVDDVLAVASIKPCPDICS
jgi:hypothetical protein|eukprot:SAG25_NODE_2178_length_1866_cov_2.513865_2_plen_50_part_00